MIKQAVRCALYTRKSSDEGLEQEFNSLDAQREACAAYVKSQAAEGWRALPARYDDGGFSGGSMDRPGLKRLMADIAAGLIDTVVVYKIDRLTRSLADFARIVEQFEAHGVTFVSVTQAFNTTNSMGRLMLNVLLSFAQFEREITGERIRDKIAASKKKGMWMGGVPPLGYDMPRDGSRILTVNPSEADLVRTIFALYLELGSVHMLAHEAAARGLRSKAWCTSAGRARGGVPLSRGALFHVLRNRVYIGEITHGKSTYPGIHEPIVDRSLFDAVQKQLDLGNRRTQAEARTAARSALTARVFDADGTPMSPSFSRGRTGKLYRYYVSSTLQTGSQRAREDKLRRVSARELERTVEELLARVAPELEERLAAVTRIDVHADALIILFRTLHTSLGRRELETGEQLERMDGGDLRLTSPVRMKLRGGRTVITGRVPQPVRRDAVLIKALRRAHVMIGDDRGMPTIHAAPESPYDRRMIRLAFLSPDLQADILAGRQPRGLTLEWLMKNPLPPCWTAQKRMLAALD